MKNHLKPPSHDHRLIALRALSRDTLRILLGIPTPCTQAPLFIPSSLVGSCRSPGSPEEHLHFGKDRLWYRSHQCPVNRAYYSCGIGGEVRGSGGRNFRRPSLLPMAAPCTEGVSGTGDWQGHTSIGRWGEQGCVTGLLLQQAGPVHLLPGSVLPP